MTKPFRHIALTRIVLASTAVIGMLVAGGARAQYTGPSSASPTSGYAGPSRVPVMTVKEILENGKDDQHAILRGRIVSHDGDDHYTFDDGTGTIRVEIDDDDFPAGVKIDDKVTVELHGEIDHHRHRPVDFDVDEVRVK